jgi:hypothetical protein
MHNGIKYRSLLEAKWASFFTRIGWQFEYEPFEGNGYIPDFVIYGETPFAIEVKPAVSWKELQSHQEKTRAGLQDIWDHDILIVGASPVEFRSLAGESAIGLLGVRAPNAEDGQLHTIISLITVAHAAITTDRSGLSQSQSARSWPGIGSEPAMKSNGAARQRRYGQLHDRSGRPSRPLD